MFAAVAVRSAQSPPSSTTARTGTAGLIGDGDRITRVAERRGPHVFPGFAAALGFDFDARARR